MLRRPRSALLLAAALATFAFAQVVAQADGRQARQIIRRVYNPAKKGAPLPPQWNIAGYNYLAANEYKDLKGGVMELLRRYPPSQYFFVGLGRDPAPVIAMLQNLGEKELAVNLPGTSNIGWQGQVDDTDVARHIEAAIPDKILKGERTIVILDVTSSGKTPAVFGPYLDKYLQARGNTRKPVRLAFSWVNVKQAGSGYAAELTDWINTSQWPDYSNYYGGKYEGSWTPGAGGYGIAEHERHSMSRGAVPPSQTSPNYRQFRDALMARMEQDDELDTFLAQVTNAPPPKPPAPPKPWPAKLTYKLDGRKAAAAGSMLTLKNVVKAKKEKKAKDAADVADAAEVAEAGEAEEKQPDSFDYLSQREYADLRNGGLAILNHAPPSKAYYVGVGRSSAPLVAFLENLGSDVATYLPTDGLQRLAAGKGGSGAPAALDAVFDAYLPEGALRGTRKIVLFQRSDSGASLPYLQGQLNLYLSRHGSPAQVEILSLGDTKPAQGGFIDVSGNEELELLNNRKYHLVAPYDYFRPGRQELTTVVDAKGKATPRGKSYGAFKQALGQRMTADATLDQALQALP